MPKWMTVVREISAEGFGRIKYNIEIRRLLNTTDRQFRNYFEGKTSELPPFYMNRIKKNPGILREWLPDEAIDHDPNTYLKSTY